MTESSFGQRLRDARRDAGLSQSELELRSGIPKARLSRYENGHVLPSISTLGKLARALTVSEARLLGDQRAIVDEFFNVLFERGVVIASVEQSRKVAGAVADIYEASLTVTKTDTPEPLASPPVASASFSDVVELDGEQTPV